MDDTTKLIVESLMLLLEVEEELCNEELKLHRHPIRRSVLSQRLDSINMRLLAMDNMLYPPEEVADENRDGAKDPDVSRENKETATDTEGE